MQRAALELLEHLAASVRGTRSETREFTGEVVEFILGDAVSASLPKVLHSVCALIAVRVLSKQLSTGGGYDALPPDVKMGEDGGWGKKAVILACSANLSSSLVQPAGRFVADLISAGDEARTSAEEEQPGRGWDAVIVYVMVTARPVDVPPCVHGQASQTPNPESFGKVL